MKSVVLFEFHETREKGVSGVAERLVATQGGICLM